LLIISGAKCEWIGSNKTNMYSGTHLPIVALKAHEFMRVLPYKCDSIWSLPY